MTKTEPQTPAAPSGVDPTEPGRGFTLITRALRLRCPHCGRASLRGPSWMKLRRVCPSCGLRTERGEEDFFLGAMMFNIALSEGVLALAIVGVVVGFWPDVPWAPLGWTALVLMAIAPFAFFPFSNTLWLAADMMIRPVTPDEMEWHRTQPHDTHRNFRDR
ncbi:MAG TPA: hypothetical protein VF665_08335 [Longimicrobium sp.]|uniref:DUF983 domain-containing protein n=1 Tax=Longimicrobium sp. TaxID=2029185 RepID=UPI002EDB925A